ncbi:MAG: hypothetical protein AABX29_05990 [Nanoarchaeota archaeon]
MPKVPFNTLFKVNANGSIEPIQQIRVGGITLSPGVILSPGQVIAGIDFSQYRDRNFEIAVDGSLLVIKGIYGQGQ